VATVQTGAIAVGGVGETGVPCIAPAIANAYAKLTGTRVRALPPILARPWAASDRAVSRKGKRARRDAPVSGQ